MSKPHPNPSKKTLITIGSFDGVHLGHKALIARTLLEAKKRHWKALALTFLVPPKMILDKKFPYHLLTTPEEKKFLIRKSGIRRVVSLNFDKKLSEMRPFNFFRDLLINQHGARGLVVGHDFRFGVNRSAGAEQLVQWGQEFEIPVWVIPPVKKGRNIISSTKIRKALNQNRFHEALSFMGNGYVVMGKVVKGQGRGKDLGFPTANLKISKEKILPRGVFAVRGSPVAPRMKWSYGVCNIGVRPTFYKTSRLSVEVHFFGRKRSFLGKYLVLELRRKIRPEKKFSSAQQLIAALQSDTRKARAFFAQK